MAKYCAYCGSEMPDQAKFCGVCGGAFPSGEAPEDNGVRRARDPQQTGSGGNGNRPPKRPVQASPVRRRRPIGWMVAAAVLLVLAAAGIFAVFSGGGKGAQSADRSGVSADDPLRDDAGQQAPADTAFVPEAIPGCFSCITVGGRADWKILPKADGTFDGVFQMWDWGDQGPEYPNGTCYLTAFSGVFSEVEKESEYSYKMTAGNMENTYPAEETFFSDDVRYVAEADTGLQNGDVFYLFLPGMPRSELPQGLIDSVNNNGFHSMDDLTPDTYILYHPIPESNGYDLVFIGKLEREFSDRPGEGQPETGRRLTTLTAYTSSGQIWYRHVFDWDENGKLVQVQEVEDPEYIKTWTFQYNEQEQLLREDLSAGGYSYTCQEYTYSSDGKVQTGRAATEDGYREDTYHYDSDGRLWKVTQTDDYSRRETIYTDFNEQGSPTRSEITETFFGSGSQVHAAESFLYDSLNRKTQWNYSDGSGAYSMTYRYDIQPFVFCQDAQGAYTLLLKDADGKSCWQIDVGCVYTPQDNGVLSFQAGNADTGALEVDPEGYLTRISFSDGSSFEFLYSSASEPH